MSYLKDKSYYEDLYDLFTIKDCLRTVETSRKVIQEKQKIGKKKLEISVDGFENLLLYFKKGERYRNRTSTIQEWETKDEKLDNRLNTAIFPSYTPCQHCGMEIEEEDRYIEDILNLNSRVQFFAHCKNCKRVTILYDNGEIYSPKPSLCPKCNSELKTSSTYKKNISTIKETCPKCQYKNKIVIDHEKEDQRREIEERRNSELLEKYRSVYCISTEEGQKYIQEMDNLKRLTEMIKESEEKKKDPHYQKAMKVKKLTVIELQKLLSKKFKAEGYINLNFENPEIDRYVIVPFTAQDSKKSRNKEKSIKDLNQILKLTLDNINWRLMSDGLEYRMGYLKGRLKGYESDEELAKFIKKRDNKRPLFRDKDGPVY